MPSTDLTDDIVGALKLYFSAPIARALLTSTLRRARLDGGPLDNDVLPDAVVALERTLPMYITDATRRGECVERLLGLLPNKPCDDAPQPRPRASAPAMSVAWTVVQVKTADDVGNACEVGRDIARRVGFAGLDQTKVATTISELARNIILYAAIGEVRIAGIEKPRKGVEVAAVDEGPGIADLGLVMSSAYRSKTGMGKGLKGAKRLMDTFDLSSVIGVGTTVVTRKFVP